MLNKIKQMREKRNISQTELSVLSRVSRAFISKIENNKVNPSIEVVSKIAIALKCTVDELLENNHPPHLDTA